MKASNVPRLILYSILLVLCMLIFVKNIVSEELQRTDVRNAIHFTSTEPLSGITVAVSSHQVLLQQKSAGEDAITVELRGSWSHSQKEAIHCAVQNGELTVSATKHAPVHVIGIGLSKKAIVISVPPALLVPSASLDVHLSSGDFEAQNIQAHAIQLSLKSGSARLTHCTSDTVLATLSSGSLSLSGAFGSIDAQESSGSMHIINERAFEKDSSFRTASGSITLCLAQESAFCLRYQVASGSVKNAFTGSTFYKGSGEETVGTGGPVLAIAVSSGSAVVKKCAQ